MKGIDYSYYETTDDQMAQSFLRELFLWCMYLA